jgi:hypothetical protein
MSYENSRNTIRKFTNEKVIPIICTLLILSFFTIGATFKVRNHLRVVDSLFYADSSVVFDSTQDAKIYWNPADSTLRFTAGTTGTLYIADTLETNQTFTWRYGYLSFLNGATYISNESSVHPTATNGNIFASLPFAQTLFNGRLVIDQITLNYTSVDSVDMASFFLIRTDLDGTNTIDVTVDSIGYNLEGAQDSTMLVADITLAGFAYFMYIDVVGTDANTDFKVYSVDFITHLEK